jgi:hypothetical protein
VQFSLPHNDPSRQPDNDMPNGGRQHSAVQVQVAKPNSFSTVDNTIAASLGPYCVVHIGKTAGGTLSCRFATWLAKSCASIQKYKKPSPFTAKVVGKFHKNRDWGCLKRKRKPKIFLFTLRHPLNRIVSWFYYEHMDKANVNEIMGNRPLLYKDCFDSLDDLSQIGLQVALEYNGNNSTFVDAKNGQQDPKRFSLVCAKRAWNAISGHVGYQYHNFYNYGYYKSWVDHVTGASNYNVLAIRSEHLEEDWDRLEYLYNNSNRRRRGQAPSPDPAHHHHRHLDGTRDEHIATEQRHGSNSSVVSPSSYPNLCRALCQEIKVYTNLLIQAINLTPKQIQESLSELYAKCPKSIVTHCVNNPRILDVVDKARIADIPGFPKK